MDLPPDVELEGRYELLGHIATGGFAEVYRVCHVQLGTIHALKVIATRSPLVRARLLEEGRIQARLRHANVVRVTDVVDVDGQPGLIMDYVAGPTLQELVSEKNLQLYEAVELGGRIIEGTAAAHDIGLVHRDLKPANILLEPSGPSWNPRVTDFGLAKALEADGAGGETRANIAMGTPGYMAPEQYRDAASVDQRADVFALGAILYRIITGTRPFPGKHLPELLLAAELSQYAPVQALAPELPAGLAAVITTCLAPSPQERFQDAGAVARAWAAGSAGRVESMASADSQSYRTSIPPIQQVRSSKPPPTVATAPDTFMMPADQAIGSGARAKTLAASMERSQTWDAVAPEGLPQSTGPFVGRDDGLSALDRLMAGGARVVTLLATAGVGKTRMAAHYADTRWRSFRGGVLFCDLTEARSPADMLGELALCLELQLVDEDASDRVADAMRARGRVLVILDNFEQLVHVAASTLDALSKAAPESVYLVTSREALQVPSEVVMRLDPLGLPESDTPDAVLESEAGTLFVARAQTVRSGFAVNDDNAADVAAILRELDGIPLAVELAASRTRAMRPKQIRQRLGQRFRLLRSNDRGLSGRSATLEGAIEWSWDLLEPHERAALTQCSVFAGTFRSDAADEVVDVSDWMDAPWTIDVLEALIDKCLLRAIESPEGLRLGHFASIRAFAANQLARDGAVETPDGVSATGPAQARVVQLRHAEYFAGLLPIESLPDSLWISGGDRRYDELDSERENILAAFEHAMNADAHELAGRLAVLYCSIALIGGPFGAALSLMERAVAHEVPLALRWRLLWLIAAIAPALGKSVAGFEAADEALKIAHEQGWRECEARTLREWGNCRGAIDGPAVALDAYRRGLELLEDGEAPFVESLICYNLADDALRRGAVDEAATWAARSLSAASGAGIKVLVVTAHTQLGAIARIAGDLAAARSHLEQAVEVGATSRNRQWEVEAKPELARVLTGLGELEPARKVLAEAIDAAVAIGDAHDSSRIRYELARIELRAGHDQRAQRIAEQLDDEWRRSGSTDTRVYARLVSALVHLRHDRASAALVAARNAIDAARSTGNPDLLGAALAMRARCLRTADRLDEARMTLDEGSALDLGAAARASICVELGGLELALGDALSARKFAETAEGAARSIGDIQQLGEALLVRAGADVSDGTPETAREAFHSIRQILGATPGSVDHSLEERLLSLEQANAGSAPG